MLKITLLPLTRRYYAVTYISSTGCGTGSTAVAAVSLSAASPVKGSRQSHVHKLCNKDVGWST